jgi:hypothetical protein
MKSCLHWSNLSKSVDTIDYFVNQVRQVIRSPWSIYTMSSFQFG